MTNGVGDAASRRRLRIAHVSATFPPYHGGTGNVAYHNARELARLGHEVHVFTAAGSHSGGPGRATAGVDAAGEQGAGPLAVHRLPALFRFGNAPLLPGLARLGRFDVVHLHYPFYFGAETLLVRSWLDGRRFILTYHQDVLFPGPLRYPEKLHHHLVGRHVLRRASRVLATSWDYARASRIRELLDRRADAVDVLPNGVDADRFHPSVDGAACRARYGFVPADRVILFVGGLDRAHHFKGVPVLLDALARLPDPDIKLLIVGNGDLLPGFRRRAVDLGLADRVTFCGRVSDEALPGHYAAGDVAVLPSTTMGEAFGIVLLEAMATGRSVVASGLPGVRTVAVDGVAGLLAEPGDADDLAARLRALLDDPRLRARMGEAGRRLVEQQYAWPRIGARLEHLYYDVLAEAERSRTRRPSRSGRAAPDAPVGTRVGGTVDRI